MKIVQTIFAIIILGVFVFVGYKGIGKQEAADCLKWQKESKEYPGYFLLQWQKDQCDAHGIEIDAHVLSIVRD